MRMHSLWVGCLAAVAAAAITGVASAAPVGDSVSPNIAVGLQFGGTAQSHQLPMRFTAQFDVRSNLLRRGPDLLRTSLAPGQSADLATISAGVPLLTILQLSANRKGFDLVNVMGRDLLAKAELDEAGESHWYNHKWIWWTAGAIAATGAAMAAGGSHSDRTDPSSNNNGCDGVSSQGNAMVNTSQPSQSQPTCPVKN